MEPDDSSIMSQCTQDFRQLALAPDALWLELESSFARISTTCGKTELSVIDQLATVADVHTFCAMAYEALTAFRRSNKQDCVRLEQECQRLEIRLIETSKEHSLASARLEKEKKEQLGVDRKAASQASEIASFEATIGQEEAKFRDSERQCLENSKRVTNGLEDIIPIFGIFNAISSGNALRAIPFYSLIDGAIAVARERRDRAREDANGLRQRLN